MNSIGNRQFECQVIDIIPNLFVKLVVAICPIKCWRIVGRDFDSRHGVCEFILDEEPGGCARMLAGRTVRNWLKPQCAGNGSELVRVGR